MANFQTVYAWITLFVSLTLITSFIVEMATPQDKRSGVNGKFVMFGSIATLFITLIGSITVLAIRGKKGAVLNPRI